ncbi:MAG TPA: TolC family protein [Bryobacteraceae bacterium]|nr:TolC family protein [Bryobacteraceae bacterium]
MPKEIDMRVRKNRIKRVVPVALLAAGSVCAQTAMPLSLKRAVEIALAPDGNTRVALAEESIEQAKTRQAQAKAAFLPNLDASVQDRREVTNLQAFGFNFKLPIPGFAIPSIVGPFTVFDARATAQQSVLNFSDVRRYRASKITVAATATDAAATRNNVSDEVARDYLACLRADANRETARSNVELSETLLKLAQQQKSAGTGTGIEVTRAEVQLANDRQSLIRAENDRNRATLTLLKAMGLRLDAPVDFTNKLEFRPVDTATDATLVEQARKSRPELKTQQQREDAARVSVDAVKSERLPSVGASADYGTIGSAIVGTHPTYTLGVSLKVPVFDGARREARIGESTSQYRQEQLRTRDLGQQIDLQVRTALENLRSAAAEVQAATEGQTLAESELAQARRRYEAGVATSVEVTDAQTRLQRARDNLVIALYDHNVARLDLATATGTIGEYVNQ